MEITDVRLRKIETEGKLRAYVSITFDDSFVVHDLRVIDGNKGYHKDIAHPINTEIREKIQNAVLDVYNRELEEAPQAKVEEAKVEETKEEETKEEEKVEVAEETAAEEETEKKEEGLF